MILIFALVIHGCLSFAATQRTNESVFCLAVNHSGVIAGAKNSNAACCNAASWFFGVLMSFTLMSGPCHLYRSVYRVLMREEEEEERGGCGIGGIQLDGVGDCGE